MKASKMDEICCKNKTSQKMILTLLGREFRVFFY
jgi:hypothetical protein